MTLQEIRKQFIEQSGRYDLGIQQTDGTFLDNGANYYINSGLRMLGGFIDVPAAEYIKTTSIVAGENTLSISKVATVTKLMYRSNGGVDEGSWFPLIYVPFNEFINTYPAALNDDADTTAYTGLECFTVMSAVDDTTTFASRSIVLNCRLTDALEFKYMYTLIQKLSAETDINFYTINYPELVVDASCYRLEASYRNTEGMKDWMNAMRPTLDAIDNATVRQMLQDEMVMML